MNDYNYKYNKKNHNCTNINIKLNSILNEYTKKYEFINKINTLNKLQNKTLIFKSYKYDKILDDPTFSIVENVELCLYKSLYKHKIDFVFNCNYYNAGEIINYLYKYINKHFKNKYSDLSSKEIIKMFKIVCNHYINIYKQK